MYVITGKELDELGRISQKILEHLRKNPDLVDIDSSLVYGKPELRLTIDRNRAADLQVNAADIATTVNTFLAGEKVSTFSQGQNQYNILLRALPEHRRDEEAILGLAVPTRAGGTVELRNVARLERGTGPGSIDRLSRQRQVTVFANTKPGIPESAALAELEQFVKTLGLPPGYQPLLTGNSKELQRTGYYFLIACGLSFAFMYMVLAAQFESFIHPVTILLTLPLSVPFGLLSTWLAREPLNIFSALGILLLFGVVKKNAILQIDHTNELRKQGLSRYDAILQANRHRLRPILMTTIALVAGMLPLLFGKGPGARTNFSIAILVVGGQTLCLLLTLLAVPVIYSLFEDGQEWIVARIRGRKRAPFRPLAESLAEMND
jgi:HAE1 family hydrophobic/amphiphilic exporter-1